MFKSRKMETTKLCLLMFAGCLFTTWSAGQAPLNTGVLILSPHFFPGWQAQHVTHPFVLYEEGTPGRYRMYYAGSSSTQVNESLWDQWVTGVVTSSDAVNWQYPENYEQVLFATKFMEGDVVDPDEQARIFDSVFAIDAVVLKDAALYKCWYTGWNGETREMGGGLSDKINFRIGYATSADGLTWKEVKGTAGAGAVLGVGGKGDSDQLGVEDPYLLKENGTFRMWYVGYDGKNRRIHYAVSTDGVTWTKKGIAIALGGRGELDESGARSPVVIRRSGEYELWYLAESRGNRKFHVVRASSADGKSWQKKGEVLLHPEVPAPSWPWSALSLTGRERIVLGNIIVRADNSCQVFYAKEFTASRKATYAELTAPISYIFTERVDP